MDITFGYYIAIFTAGVLLGSFIKSWAKKLSLIIILIAVFFLYDRGLLTQILSTIKTSIAGTRLEQLKMPSNYIDIDLKEGTYTVVASILNVRAEPNDKSIVLYQLNDGDIVKVKRTIAGWAQISKEMEGKKLGISGYAYQWVRANFLVSNQQNINTSLNLPLIYSNLYESDLTVNELDIALKRVSSLVKNGTCTINDANDRQNYKITRNDIFLTCSEKDNVIRD